MSEQAFSAEEAEQQKRLGKWLKVGNARMQSRAGHGAAHCAPACLPAEESEKLLVPELPVSKGMSEHCTTYPSRDCTRGRGGCIQYTAVITQHPLTHTHICVPPCLYCARWTVRTGTWGSPRLLASPGPLLHPPGTRAGEFIQCKLGALCLVVTEDRLEGLVPSLVGLPTESGLYDELLILWGL